MDEQRWNPVHRWKAGIKKEKIGFSPPGSGGRGRGGGRQVRAQMLLNVETGTCIINEEGKSSAESEE